MKYEDLTKEEIRDIIPKFVEFAKTTEIEDNFNFVDFCEQFVRRCENCHNIVVVDDEDDKLDKFMVGEEEISCCEVCYDDLKYAEQQYNIDWEIYERNRDTILERIG